MIQKVHTSLSEIKEYMNTILPIQESFDLVERSIWIGGKESVFYFVDGLLKDEAMVKIMTAFFAVKEQDLPEDAETFAKKCIPCVEVDAVTDFEEIVKGILSGVLALFIDGYESCIMIDCRTYPARSVDEPEKDKSLRGSRDGFVETIVFDTALIRSL